ncbi:MAG: hypothetical protein MUO68_08040 [Desulfobacteraceae bacterium]|jgi:hypothetical protein|nr:hypothetical protein [Desulfobacteraceae bacterium]
MDQEEYDRKYVNLRVLKSIQEYLKTEGDLSTAVYPIKVPQDLLYQVLKIQGPDNADKLIHQIFRLGLEIWSDDFFNETFGSQQNLERFIEMVKKRNKGEGG